MDPKSVDKSLPLPAAAGGGGGDIVNEPIVELSASQKRINEKFMESQERLAKRLAAKRRVAKEAKETKKKPETLKEHIPQTQYYPCYPYTSKQEFDEAYRRYIEENEKEYNRQMAHGLYR